MRTMAKSFNLEMMSRPKEKCTAVRMRPEEGFCVQSGYCAAIFGIKIDDRKPIMAETTSHGTDEKRGSRRDGHQTRIKKTYPTNSSAVAIAMSV